MEVLKKLFKWLSLECEHCGSYHMPPIISNRDKYYMDHVGHYYNLVTKEVDFSLVKADKNGTKDICPFHRLK